MDKIYFDRVQLLLEVMPEVFKVPAFAMKGGTAINLFVQDMPRLSVDIDVVYTDHSHSRKEAMKNISNGLNFIKALLEKKKLHVHHTLQENGEESKMTVQRIKSMVKIEVNHVFRGTILPVVMRPLNPRARDTYSTHIDAPTLHEAELYGSKLVAALDRQHPRDLFDLHCLLERGDLTEEIIDCFVCYLELVPKA